MKALKRLTVIFLLVIFIYLWQNAAMSHPEVRFFVSSPSSCLHYGLNHAQNLWKSTLVTSEETISGFGLAIGFSFLIMLACMLYPTLLRLILPIFVTSQVLPIITLAPLFIILFGLGLLSKIVMVALMSFFPIFFNFSAGVNSIPQDVHDLLYVYDARRLFSIFHIAIPISTPNIFTGLKVSTTMALMGAIVAEFVGARDGLGKNLYLAPKNTTPELMICSIVLTTLLGWTLFKSVELIELKIGKWYTADKLY